MISYAVALLPVLVFVVGCCSLIVHILKDQSTTAGVRLGADTRKTVDCIRAHPAVKSTEQMTVHELEHDTYGGKLEPLVPIGDHEPDEDCPICDLARTLAAEDAKRLRPQTLLTSAAAAEDALRDIDTPEAAYLRARLRSDQAALLSAMKEF